ncbi:hypothetical protein M758_7G186200 [Ceratodon purpureus]|nr:hypothetical protein M758_7G186200 [Ceratodon purpureus]
MSVSWFGSVARSLAGWLAGWLCRCVSPSPSRAETRIGAQSGGRVVGKGRDALRCAALHCAGQPGWALGRAGQGGAVVWYGMVWLLV